MKAPLRRDLGVVGPSDLDARFSESRCKLLERRDRLDGERGVRLLGRREGILDADVQLPCSCAEPAPSTPFEDWRLLDLGEPEQAAVEGPRSLLAPRWRRNLNVMNTRDRGQSDKRPSYSGRGFPATTMYVTPPEPAVMRRVDAASIRR